MGVSDLPRKVMSSSAQTSFEKMSSWTRGEADLKSRKQRRFP